MMVSRLQANQFPFLNFRFRMSDLPDFVRIDMSIFFKSVHCKQWQGPNR
jgi:hypothetical protein